MTPDDITPAQALASAYLDGDVTAGERARVEAAPELLAMVASMRQVATLVAAVPAPTKARRESGITAALAEFDRHATGGSAQNGNVVALASRQRLSNAVLSAAAAVVLLGVVGISLLNSGSSNDKSETASLETDTKVADPAAAEDAAGATVAPTSGGEVMVTLAAPVAIDNVEQLAALTVPEPAADSSPDDTTAADGDGQRLESFNIDALECMDADQVFLADIYYQGMLAIAVRDTVTGVTEAIDSTCTVLARVS